MSLRIGIADSAVPTEYADIDALRRCRVPDVEDQRQIRPIWMVAEKMRPDEGVRAHISVGTAVIDQGASFRQPADMSPLLNPRCRAYRAPLAAKMSVHRRNPAEERAAP